MKSMRFITFLLILVIAFSACPTSPVLAKPDSSILANSMEGRKKPKIVVKPVILSLWNYTGGVITIRLYGATRNYVFVASKQGFNRFAFKTPSGKYTYELTSSACPEASVTKTKEIAHWFALGKWVCKKAVFVP
jgi:hypothetical protein